MKQETAPAESKGNLTGTRIVAALIDIVLLAVLGLAMAAVFGEVGETEENAFEVNLGGLPFLVYVFISLGYYFVLESNGGQTLGKRLMGIRVAALDGSLLTPGKVATRTILRFIDALPFLYLVGLIAVAVSQRDQRLGDMAAGTIIVRASKDTS